MPLDCTNYIEPLTETEQGAKADLHRWLDRFPERVPALLEAVREGRIDGWSFRGSCRCVIGTLEQPPFAADAREYLGLSNYGDHAIEPFIRDTIKPGDTPANNTHSAHLERWIMEWMG